MRATRLYLRNILGHEEFEINDLGDFNLIEGLNEEGKSSVIEAIRSLSHGGHDATLLRNGKEEGVIVLDLDDESELRKKVTAQKSEVSVRRPDVGQISAAQTFIRSIIDTVDPTDMLAERDELRRTQFLLEALPLELNREEIDTAIDGLMKVADSDFVGHPLTIIDQLHKRVYEERQGINREAKAKKASIDQLSASLKDAVDEDPAKEIRELESEREKLPGRTVTTKEEIEATAADEIEVIEEPIKERIQKLQERIDLLTAEMESQTKVISDRRDAGVAEIETAERVRNAEIKSRLEALRAGQDARAAAANTRKVVDGFKTEHTNLTAKSDNLTDALARLQAVKLGLQRKIPLKGVEIIDGVIHENGVPWKRINKANQVKIAINLARLRAKELPLVPIDNIECLDGPTLEAFRKNAPKSGLQFIITKVRQDPNDKRPGLTVTKDHAAKDEVPAEVGP